VRRNGYGTGLQRFASFDALLQGCLLRLESSDASFERPLLVGGRNTIGVQDVEEVE
jgi:hypothetical protein